MFYMNHHHRVYCIKNNINHFFKNILAVGLVLKLVSNCGDKEDIEIKRGVTKYIVN